MWQKIIVSVLALTIVGAAGVGLYDATQSSVAAATPEAQLVAPTPQANPAGGQGQGQGGPPEQAGGQGVADSSGPLAVQQQQSLDRVGDPWSGSGTIAALSDFGLTLALADDLQVYVELGPPTYWQAQGMTLAVGDVVTVDGFFNGEQVHARTITLADGTQGVLRTAEGQPLWAGGVDQTPGGNGAGGGGASGGVAGGTGQVQVPAEEWVTLSGVITALTTSGLTVQTETGGLLTLQLGRADFWQGQGVTLAIGDEITVLGFWQGDQFQAGEIMKVATGERIMLRDPNGRPLWGGPGRNGSGSAQGTQGQAQGGQADQGQSGQGQGNGYRGGRS